MDTLDESLRDESGEVARLRARLAALEAQLQATTAALTDSEARGRAMVEEAPVLLWIANAEGQCTYFNTTWLRYTGRSMEQERGDGWAEGVHPGDLERCLSVYRSALARREPFEMEYRLRRADGAYGWVLDRGFPRFDQDGALVGYIGSATDTSERKRMAAALQAGEEQLRLLMDSITDYAIFMLDPRGRIASWSEGAERISGYMSAEIIGQPIERLYPPEVKGQGKPERELELALERGRYEEEAWRVRKDGSRFWGHIISTPVWDEAGHLRGFARVMHDVTERKEAEERLRVALEAGGMGLWDWNVETGELVWSDTLAPTQEAQPGSFAGPYDDFLTFVHPDDRDRLQQELSRAIRSGGAPRVEFRLRGPGGETRWISAEGHGLQDATGRTVRLLGISQDITERMQEEHLLHQREQEMKALIENAPDIIARFDRQARHLYVNRAVEGASGRRAAEFIGKTNAELGMPEEIYGQWLDTIEEVFETGEERQIEFSYPSPGGTRWFSSRVAPEIGPDGRVTTVLGITRDITDRKQAEETMRFLAEASNFLTSTLDYQTTLRQISELVVPRLADWCVIDMLREDGRLERLAVTHGDPARVEQARALHERYPPPPDAAYGPGAVARTGRSQAQFKFTDDLLERYARDPEHLEVLRGMGLSSYMCVPLKAHDRTLGAISFAMSDSGRYYGPADLALAEELGRRAAIAVENAQLYQAEQQARWQTEQAASRTARLQAISGALADLLDAQQVTRLITEQAVAAMRASAGVVVVPTADGEALEPVVTIGYPAPVLAPYRRIAREAEVPLAEAIRARQPIWVESWSELRQRYPALSEAQTSNQSWIAVPLVTEGRPLGALGLSFRERRAFSAEDKQLIVAIARQGAQALHRAHLYQAEQRARAEAEHSEQRLAFLAEASSVLASSLDYQHTLQAVVQLVAPRLADWCLLDIREGDGYQRLAVLHSDPSRRREAERLSQYPPDLNAPGGSGKVLRTGQPEFYAELSDEAAMAAARNDPELLALLRQMGFASYVIVPLIARDRTLGALSLVAGEARRRYGPADLALAAELARRAAIAIDNARLYREAQDAIREREAFVATASHELRTPLTTVKVYTSLLASHLAQTDWEHERIMRFSRQLQEQVARLEALVVDLLDAARVQQGRLELRLAPMDLRQLAGQALARFEENPDRTHAHTLVLDAPEPVRGLWDASRLDQVITNLISNALKYSPDGGEVRLRVRYVDHQAELAVSDQGIGVTKEEQGRLFRPFGRGETARRGISGVGLGLYISAQIVGLHGGTLTLRSEPGVGSVFTVSLPPRPPGAAIGAFDQEGQDEPPSA